MKFCDCLTEQKICSGHTIVMRTDDPINRPLPSGELCTQDAVAPKSSCCNFGCVRDSQAKKKMMVMASGLEHAGIFRKIQYVDVTTAIFKEKSYDVQKKEMQVNGSR
jgi:hypothetical protein